LEGFRCPLSLPVQSTIIFFWISISPVVMICKEPGPEEVVYYFHLKPDTADLFYLFAHTVNEQTNIPAASFEHYIPAILFFHNITNDLSRPGLRQPIYLLFSTSFRRLYNEHRYSLMGAVDLLEIRNMNNSRSG